MDREKALKFVQQMVDTYGVRSCFDNDDDESIWFECPSCGEPILIGEDWNLEDILEVCPVCEERYDEE